MSPCTNDCQRMWAACGFPGRALGEAPSHRMPPDRGRSGGCNGVVRHLFSGTILEGKDEAYTTRLTIPQPDRPDTLPAAPATPPTRRGVHLPERYHACTRRHEASSSKGCESNSPIPCFVITYSSLGQLLCMAAPRSVSDILTVLRAGAYFH